MSMACSLLNVAGAFRYNLPHEFLSVVPEVSVAPQPSPHSNFVKKLKTPPSIFDMLDNGKLSTE